MSDDTPSSVSFRLTFLPYFRFAWLFSAAWVSFYLIVVATDNRIPIPHTLTMMVVVVSSLMGGRLSGFLSALIPVLAGLYLFYGVPGASTARSEQSLVLGSFAVLALGFFLGSLRQALENARAELEKQSRKISDQNVVLSQRVDENSEALNATRERLLESQERLRNATRRLIDAQETERRSLAKELHDDIGQSLTALRINLESNKRSFSQDATSLKFIETSYGLVDEIIASVRELSLMLRPSLLDDLGLIAALREYVTKTLERADISLDFEAHGTDESIEATHSIAAYRIVQETISNVVKHASADHVDLLLAVNTRSFRITIRDDGVGFNVDLDDLEQVGLASIRERASLLGGNVEIDSTPGKGTMVIVVIPVSFNVDEDAAA